MNRAFWSVVVLLFAPVLVAAPVPKSVKKKADENDIIGLWVSRPGQPSGWYFNTDGSAGCGTPGVPGGCAKIVRNDDGTYDRVTDGAGIRLRWTSIVNGKDF